GLSKEILGAILKGGFDKMTEAGAIIVGGHTIDDAEPKYGLSVTGIVKPGEQVANIGARPGDRLVLTKPIGTGIITTALKIGKGDKAIEARVVEVMSTLNKSAAEVMVHVGVHACTDITGFGLIGHLREMVQGSGVGARINLSKVPTIPGLWALAEEGIAPSGTNRNLQSVREVVVWEQEISHEAKVILCDAQTSGGLLISIAAEKTDKLLDALAKAGVEDAAVIGEVVDDPRGIIQVAA
ncbi:MAG: selenide, water dikinase SelD, partial [Dehalococcoidia bacterium]